MEPVSDSESRLNLLSETGIPKFPPKSQQNKSGSSMNALSEIGSRKQKVLLVGVVLCFERQRETL